MDEARLAEAEALRNLLDGVELMDREARRLLEQTGSLVHTSSAFVRAVVQDHPADAGALLLELGAALERAREIAHARAALEEALGALGFHLHSDPGPPSEIQERALSSLRERIAARARVLP